jgi:hypothetical protein
VIARLRDAQVYPQAAAAGSSILEMRGARVAAHQQDWEPILEMLHGLGINRVPRYASQARTAYRGNLAHKPYWKSRTSGVGVPLRPRYDSHAMKG